MESMFKDGMTWEKYGHLWHIDHAVPLCFASTKEEVEKLFHYTNLQPMWAHENLKKGCSVYYIKKNEYTDNGIKNNDLANRIKRRMEDRRIDKVAEATGLHPNTIRDVRDNPNANPTWRTVSALSAYLKEVE